jgi:hypothetical protein
MSYLLSWLNNNTIKGPLKTWGLLYFFRPLQDDTLRSGLTASAYDSHVRFQTVVQSYK